MIDSEQYKGRTIYVTTSPEPCRAAAGVRVRHIAIYDEDGDAAYSEEAAYEAAKAVIDFVGERCSKNGGANINIKPVCPSCGSSGIVMSLDLLEWCTIKQGYVRGEPSLCHCKDCKDQSSEPVWVELPAAAAAALII